MLPQRLHPTGVILALAANTPRQGQGHMQSYWTYILASKPRGTLYVGVTNGLVLA